MAKKSFKQEIIELKSQITLKNIKKFITFDGQINWKYLVLFDFLVFLALYLFMALIHWDFLFEPKSKLFQIIMIPFFMHLYFSLMNWGMKQNKNKPNDVQKFITASKGKFKSIKNNNFFGYQANWFSLFSLLGGLFLTFFVHFRLLKFLIDGDFLQSTLIFISIFIIELFFIVRILNFLHLDKYKKNIGKTILSALMFSTFWILLSKLISEKFKDMETINESILEIFRKGMSLIPNIDIGNIFSLGLVILAIFMMIRFFVKKDNIEYSFRSKSSIYERMYFVFIFLFLSLFGFVLSSFIFNPEFSGEIINLTKQLFVSKIYIVLIVICVLIDSSINRHYNFLSTIRKIPTKKINGHVIGVEEVEEKTFLSGIPLTKKKVFPIIKNTNAKKKTLVLEPWRGGLFMTSPYLKMGDKIEGYGIKWVIRKNGKDREIIIPMILILKERVSQI